MANTSKSVSSSPNGSSISIDKNSNPRNPKVMKKIIKHGGNIEVIS